MPSTCRLLVILFLWASCQASAGIVALGDINHNGSQDVAVLSHGSNTAVVKDGLTGALIQTVPFSSDTDTVWQKFLRVPDVDHNGAPELLVHKLYSSQTELRDSLSGALLSTVQFDPAYNYSYRDVAIIPDRDVTRTPHIALLGKQRTATGRVAVETREAGNGALIADTFFSSGCRPEKLSVLPDANGNGMPEFAVLCVNQRHVKVEVRDMAGILLRNIYIDKSAEYLQMEALAPTGGDIAPRLALLRYKPATNAMQVLVVNALTGASMIRTFNPTFVPRRFAVMPDLNANGSEELAFVRANPEPGVNKIQIRDSASGSLVKDVWFDKSLLPQDLAVIPDSNGNGAVELALLAIRQRDGARSVVIKDTSSSLKLGVVGFDHAVIGLKAIDAGAAHTCGLKTDGTVECWGQNFWNGRSTPPDVRLSQISAGDWITCGIGADGTVACWGSVEADAPAGPFAAVSVGAYYTCAIRLDGTVACWGGNVPTPPPGTFQQVSVSYGLNCGLKTDGRAVCWDHDFLTSSADIFSAITTGPAYVCGLKTDGSVVCWGQTDYGLATPPPGTFRQISAGDYHACGVRTEGSVACWGSNDDGQSNAPAGTFSQVAAGGRHTCALKPDGTVTCWGSNSSGQSTPGWVGD
jgi:hypothetical protein